MTSKNTGMIIGAGIVILIVFLVSYFCVVRTLPAPPPVRPLVHGDFDGAFTISPIDCMIILFSLIDLALLLGSILWALFRRLYASMSWAAVFGSMLLGGANFGLVVVSTQYFCNNDLSLLCPGSSWLPGTAVTLLGWPIALLACCAVKRLERYIAHLSLGGATLVLTFLLYVCI